MTIDSSATKEAVYDFLLLKQNFGSPYERPSMSIKSGAKEAMADFLRDHKSEIIAAIAAAAVMK